MRISWKKLWLTHQTKWRFLLVGIWNTIFGYLAFVGLDILFTFLFPKRYYAYMAAALLGNILAILNAFIFHKYVTFKSDARGKAVIIEFARFFSTYLFTMILGLVLLPFLVEVIGIDPKISGALLIPVTVIISYFGHSRFSFRMHDKG